SFLRRMFLKTTSLLLNGSNEAIIGVNEKSFSVPIGQLGPTVVPPLQKTSTSLLLADACASASSTGKNGINAATAPLPRADRRSDRRVKLFLDMTRLLLSSPNEEGVAFDDRDEQLRKTRIGRCKLSLESLERTPIRIGFHSTERVAEP